MRLPEVYILTKGERDQATYQTMRELKPWLVTHDEERAARLREECGTSRVLVSNVPPSPRGKMEQQEWLFRHIEPGRWAVVADDNIRRLQGVPPAERARWEGLPYTTERGRALTAPLAATEWHASLAETIARAERIGAHLIGFSPTGNGMQAERWGTCAFAWGKLTVWKNDPHYRYDPFISSAIEDWYHTCENLLTYGTVLIDYFSYPVAKRYEPGGLGSYDERQALRERDIRYLMERYPGLLRTKRNRNAGGAQPLGEVNPRLIRNRNTIGRWRAEFLAGRLKHHR